MKPKRILIVGFGNLGARYLQGLRDIAANLSVDIIEPKTDNYENGLETIGILKSDFKDLNHLCMEELTGHYDVVVISTSSKIRGIIAEKVLSKVLVTSWIFEKVLVQSMLDLEKLENCFKNQNVWVNTNRRIMPFYQQFLRVVAGQKKLKFSINWKNLALGCNAIHFIDLVEFLSGSQLVKISIESAGGWYESKRAGYSDFEGKLIATYSDGSSLSIDSESNLARSITCMVDNKIYFIDESMGVIHEGQEIIVGRLQYQSELSGFLVESLIKDEVENFLPDLRTSIRQHRYLFNAIADCSKLNYLDHEIWPIT
ncbi:hypothetical protein OAC99_01360 [Amylibacter sp.]|nr:hypothetical protein [Amylibacter sp.]